MLLPTLSAGFHQSKVFRNKSHFSFFRSRSEQRKETTKGRRKKYAVGTPVFSLRLETESGRRWREEHCFGVFFPPCSSHHVVLTNYYFLCCVIKIRVGRKCELKPRGKNAFWGQTARPRALFPLLTLSSVHAKCVTVCSSLFFFSASE